MPGQSTRDLTVLPVTPLATTNCPPIDLSMYAGGSFQFIFDMSGGATSAGTVKLQSSLDAVNFSDYPGSVLNFTNSTTNHIIEILDFGVRYLRPVVTVTSGTGGTFRVLGHFIELPS